MVLQLLGLPVSGLTLQKKRPFGVCALPILKKPGFTEFIITLVWPFSLTD